MIRRLLVNAKRCVLLTTQFRPARDADLAGRGGVTRLRAGSPDCCRGKCVPRIAGFRACPHRSTWGLPSACLERHSATLGSAAGIAADQDPAEIAPSMREVHASRCGRPGFLEWPGQA